MDEVFFEIGDGGDFVRVRPIKFSNSGANDSYDRNWIKTEVTVKAGAFSGTYGAEFMTVDFKEFRKQLEYLYGHLDSVAIFEGIEGYLKLSFKGDGLGHIAVFCEASDNPGYMQNILTFELHIDQTYLPALIRQVEQMNREFPVIK